MAREDQPISNNRALVPQGDQAVTRSGGESSEAGFPWLQAITTAVKALHETHRSVAGNTALNVAAAYIGYLEKHGELDDMKSATVDEVSILTRLTAVEYLHRYIPYGVHRRPDVPMLPEPEAEEKGGIARLRRRIVGGLVNARQIGQDLYRHTTHTSVADELSAETKEQLQSLGVSDARVEELRARAVQLAETLARTDLPVGKIAADLLKRDITASVQEIAAQLQAEFLRSQGL